RRPGEQRPRRDPAQSPQRPEDGSHADNDGQNRADEENESVSFGEGQGQERAVHPPRPPGAEQIQKQPRLPPPPQQPPPRPAPRTRARDPPPPRQRAPLGQEPAAPFPQAITRCHGQTDLGGGAVEVEGEEQAAQQQRRRDQEEAEAPQQPPEIHPADEAAGPP